MVCLYQSTLEDDNMYYIEVTGRPQKRVMEHNRVKGTKQTCRYTKQGSPNWSLVFLIGPILKGAHKLKQSWKDKIKEKNTDRVSEIVKIGKDLVQELSQIHHIPAEELGWELIP